MSEDSLPSQTSKTLLVASGNAGKIREFEKIFSEASIDVELVGRRDWPQELGDVDEDRETFHGNALKKAFEISLESQVTTLADDSGLVVDALQGAPGVYSARFAGPEATDQDNNRKLIESLRTVAEDERTARYVAVLALALADDELGRELRSRIDVDADSVEDFEEIPEAAAVSYRGRILLWARATCEGRIVDQPRGDGGFGYDPYFLVPEWNLTMAEVPLERKNEISHRARATRKLLSIFD